ncbi:hypothetical protein N7539_005908 [Penicillium diatomitis]|uniref:Zn(2)-C6 fungal-type domain-containing protein n=1 Tax=Penicillium diatomitis TaxID=2819901 RepID=A0A9W9X593_9EURO|nr:uncharacterized protein N7539_005908 [Penicillium diatomitis]KAJ5484112.1 hypothetical protein N7539_005908 [Penicillium diatomitis]
MVYGGKPSTGCHLCRKRKIKCDEGRPGCRNCSIYGRPCPGYRPSAVFRNETGKVEQPLKKDASPRDKSSAISNSGDSSSASASTVSDFVSISPSQMSQALTPTVGFNGTSQQALMALKPSLSLYQMADATWEQRASCFFFDQYILDPDHEYGRGHMEYVPALYARSQEASIFGANPSAACLRWAVDATGLMMNAKQRHSLPLLTRARQAYGKALRNVRTALASTEQAIRDETFAAVMVLSVYEDITGERNGLFSAHTAGLDFLMKLRGERQTWNQCGRDMFNFGWTRKYIEILVLGQNLKDEDVWAPELFNENDPIESLMLIATTMSRVFHSMQASTGLPDPTTVEGWITISQECDAKLCQWPLHLPPRWLPTTVYTTSGESLLTYNHDLHASIWYWYRAIRVMLQRFLLTLDQTYTSIRQKEAGSPDAQTIQGQMDKTRLIAICQDMTTDTCRSIPFSLAEIDSLGRQAFSENPSQRYRAAKGYVMMWPLWLMLSSGMPTPSQTQQLYSVLSQIGSAHGIKLALMLASEAERQRDDRWPCGTPFAAASKLIAI